MGIKDLIYPRFCLSCKKKGAYICPSCLSLVNYSRPVFSVDTGLDGAIAAFKYEGVIKKAIQFLKYRFTYDLATELGKEASKVVRFEPSLREPAYLVPIPLHTKREAWRGFNQADVVGKVVSRNLGLKYAPILFKRLNTKAQVELSSEERSLNLKGAFFVPERYKAFVKGGRFVLFDDVLTTGSTLGEAARELKKEGAKYVYGLTIAAN